MWQYQRTEELYHHGVLGMKWGIRRYQNKDGSLTPAGKKRAAKLEVKYQKLTGRKINSNKPNNNNQKEKKSVKDMTNEELIRTTNRLNLESNFITAVNKRNSFTPKQVSIGRKFVSKVLKDVIIPSATTAAKTQGEKFMNKVFAELLGVSEKDVRKISKQVSKDSNVVKKVYKATSTENDFGKITIDPKYYKQLEKLKNK